MAIPASPLHQKPTLGLDLQGGLEVTLQAVPPADRKLTKEDLDRSVEIMRNRVDKPRRRRSRRSEHRAPIRSSIQLPGVKDPEAAAEIIGTTAQLELFDLETSLVGPSIDARRGIRSRDARASTTCSPASRRSSKEHVRHSSWRLRRRRRSSSSGPVSIEGEGARASATASCPHGYKLFAAPPNGTVVVSLRRAGAVVCPGVGQRTRPRTRTTSSSTTRRERAAR